MYKAYANIKNKIDFERSYFYLTTLLAFMVPISRAGISILSVILFLLWIIEGDYKRKYQDILSSKILLSIIAFLAFSMLSVLWSNNIPMALNTTEKYTYWAIIFVLATSIKREYIGSIITAFLLGMLISEIIAYGVFFELWEFRHASPSNPTPFMHHITYSVFMAFSSILLLNKIFSKRYSVKEKVVFALFFLTVTGNLFLSVGRTGQIALVIGIIVMTVIHFKLSLKSLIASLLLISVIFTSAYQISDTFQKRVNFAYSDIEKLTNNSFNSSWGIRAAFWISSINIAKENLIIGTGLGDFIDVTKEELETNDYSYLSPYVKTFMSTHHPHSEYLLILLQMGLIGLFSFLYIIYNLFKLKIEDSEIKELSILFGVVFFMSCFPEPLLSKQFTLALFVLFLGLFSVYSIEKKSN